VRELINVIEQSCLLSAGHRIGVDDLPGRISGHTHRPRRSDTEDAILDLPLPEARRLWSRRFEKQYVERLLTAAQGRVGEAARQAGISPRSLHELMVRHSLRKEDFRS
jgi:DNA-binding NtrC family response regulator